MHMKAVLEQQQQQFPIFVAQPFSEKVAKAFLRILSSFGVRERNLTVKHPHCDD